MGSVVPPLFVPGVPLKLGSGLSDLHHVNLSALVFGLVCMLFLCKIIVLFDKWLVSFIIALK